jgi:hypothetical protein
MPKLTYGTHSPETLKRIQKQLASLIRDLDTLLVSMQAERVESLQISGQAELERALERVAIFIENGRQAYRKHLRERGDFGGLRESHTQTADVGADPLGEEPRPKWPKKKRG